MQKGDNICNKFVISKQQRTSLYNTVTEDNALSATLSRAALTYSKVVAGVSDALVKANTGWKIDEEFIGSNQTIVPTVEVPEVSTTPSTANTEIWNADIPNPTQAFHGSGYSAGNNTVSCLCVDDQDRIFTCSSWKTIDNDFVLLLNCFSGTEVVASATPVTGLVRDNSAVSMTIIPVACGVKQYSGNTQIVVMVKCSNCKRSSNNASVKLVVLESTLSSSTFTSCTIIGSENANIVVDDNNLPIAAAAWNSYSAIMGYAYITNQNGTYILNAYDGDAYYSGIPQTWEKTWVGLTCSNSSWFLGYLENVNTLKVMHGANLNDPDGTKTITLGIEDLSSTVPQINVFCFDQNYTNLIVGFSHASTQSYYFRITTWQGLNSRSLVFGLWFFSYLFPTATAGSKYIYILAPYISASSSSMIMAYDLEEDTLEAYNINITGVNLTSATYNKNLYIGAIKKESTRDSSGIVLVENYLTESVLIGHRLPASAPLSAIVNLTHTTGAKLQISCNNSSVPLLLFDNSGNQLYRSDLGLSYVSASETEYSLPSDSIDLNRPSIHIASNNVNSILYKEAEAYTKGTSWAYDGDLEYYVLSSKDGNFVALWAKCGAPLACVICGDILGTLYYPEFDNSKSARTAYISLGFVNGSTLQPSSSEAATNIFLAPAIQDWQFYGGKNINPLLGIEYECGCKPYNLKVNNAVYSITDFAYLTPLALGISSENDTCKFKGESGVKGIINQIYLVHFQDKTGGSTTTGYTLDNGNYLYIGNGWAIGWDKNNPAKVNPYAP